MKVLVIFTTFFTVLNSYGNITFPLQIDPVDTYECIRDVDSVVSKTNYYFTDRTYPLPIFDTSSFYCHDKDAFGDTDSEQFPRLNHIPAFFGLWDHNTDAFLDLNGNGILDIHDYLSKSIGKSIELFSPLYLANGLKEGTLKMGYTMNRFFSVNRYEFFCPTRINYEGRLLLFRALDSVVGIDTEALFKANTMVSNINDTNTLYLSETSLRKIWFQRTDGVAHKPQRNMLYRKHLYFYWPADSMNPYVKQSHQRLYRIERSILGDISIGCIPRTYN